MMRWSLMIKHLQKLLVNTKLILLNGRVVQNPPKKLEFDYPLNTSRNIVRSIIWIVARTILVFLKLNQR